MTTSLAKKSTNLNSSKDHFKFNVHNASVIFRIEFDLTKATTTTTTTKKKKKKKNEELKIETFHYDLKSGYMPQWL